MPEESKKTQQKGKNDPKDQRKRRQGRQPAGPVVKTEKHSERQIEKQSKEPDKPAYVPPGPEFYKSLKRETDEILKITEEANTKYRKKEIQSNWAKYEMPVESYEDIDEQENMGADYEKLIQAPTGTGSHFQFKHEKSWDTNTGPSLYDKYFDINMDLLTIAISTIPFYERNNIDKSMFSENDIVTMNHRAAKFKHKYYNDKKYNTPEMEAQDKILKSLSSHSNKDDLQIIKDQQNDDIIDNNFLSERAVPIKEKSLTSNNIKDEKIIKKEVDSEKENTLLASIPVEIIENKTENVNTMEMLISNPVKMIMEIKTEDISATVSKIALEDDTVLFEDDVRGNAKAMKKTDTAPTEAKPHKEVDRLKLIANEQIILTEEASKNPVIESPEDLEKWLDDFLDN